MDIRSFFQTSFAPQKAAFLFNLFSLTLAFATFYILMAEVRWVNGFDMFHKEPEQLYQIYNNGENGFNTPFLNAPSIHLLQTFSSQIEALAGFFDGNEQKINFVIRNNTEDKEAQERMLPNEIDAYFQAVTPDIGKVFTFDIIEGNTNLPTNQYHALIPLSLAEKIFGKEGKYVGNIIGGKNEKGYTSKCIIGGVYRDFPKNSTVQNYVFFTPDDKYYSKLTKNRVSWNYPCYVRLYKGVNPDSIFSDAVKINTTIFNLTKEEAAQHPPMLTLCPLHDCCFLPKVNGGGGCSLYLNILFEILAYLIIFIAAINYMNFAIAMIPHRIKSINIRKVLGASVWTLRTSLLVEAFITILIALPLTIGVLYFIIKSGYLEDILRCDLSFGVNIPILGIWGVLVVIVALSAGLYPAYYATSYKPAMVVNGNFALSPAGKSLRTGLISIQFTLSLTVIIVLLMMNSQQNYIINSPVGFARDSIIYMESDGRLYRHRAELKDKLMSNPDIAGISWCQTRLGERDLSMTWGIPNGNLYMYPVQPDYFSIMGIRLSEGRDFRPEDTGEKGVFILNETARKEFGLKLHEHLTGFWGDCEIVGFIKDVKTTTFRNKIPPCAFFVPWKYLPYITNNCVIRLASPNKLPHVCRFIEEVCQNIIEEEYIPKIMTKENIAESAYKEEYKQTRMVMFGSIISLFISIIGVFGVVLFETQAKRKEIGIRKVFGASTNSILLMFNLHYLKILAVCFIVAAPTAYYFYNIWVENFIYRTPVQWWLFGLALLVVATIICATVTIQSWKAARELPVNVIHK